MQGFTLVELLVTVALLTVTIVAVSSIFNISSDATSRTMAHAEVISASAAVQQHLTDLLSKIEPGLLIIESPAPTGARSDVPEGPQRFRIRHDRLVFIAAGSPGEFQSYTDPTVGTPNQPGLAPVSSSEALIYFGPGTPLRDTGERLPWRFDIDDYMLPGSKWVFSHRAILFVLDDPGIADWPAVTMDKFVGTGMLYGDDLHPDYRAAKMDVVFSDPVTGLRADATTFINLVDQLDISSLLGDDASTPVALWTQSKCPTSVTTANSLDNDYYTRSAFAFHHGLADFRIEWTDGRCVDPANGDYRTRWFGLRPDPNSDPATGVNYVPIRRQDVAYYAPPDDIFSDTTPDEEEAFGMRAGGTNRVEWSNPTDGSADPDAAYRAVWRTDTWQFRPKALRFTYRIYDAGNRLKHTTEVDLNEDGVPDLDPSGGTYNIVRYGQEFSIVVPLR